MAEQQEGRGQGASLRDFMSVLFRRIWIVIIIMTATLAVIIFQVLHTAPVFHSYSKLLVSRGQTTTAYSTNLKLLSWEEELSSELEAIRSARIFLRAQEILEANDMRDAKGAPVRIDPTKVDANTPGKSHVIHILYESPHEEVVQPVVHALTEAYQEFRTDTRTQDPTVLLEEEIEQLRGEITYWEQRRAEFLINAGTVELPEGRMNLLTTKRNLEVELATARSEAAQREARVDWVRESLQAHPGQAVGELYPFLEDAGRGESILAAMVRRMGDTKAAYFAAKSQYTENHPKVLTLRQELDDLEREVGEESTRYLRFVAAQWQIARAKVTSLEGSLEFIEAELRSFPDREAQLAGLDRTVTSLRTTHDALVQRRADALTVRLGSLMWDVVVLQEAVLPYRTGRVDYVRLSIIPIFALFVAVGLAFLIDGLDQTFREIKEVETHLGVPGLASVRQFRR